MFEIRDDMPLPAKLHPGRQSKYPFAALEVGACIVVPLSEGVDIKRLMQRVSRAVYSAKRLLPERKFAVRQIPEGVGVWRIE
jgi:hypothetical protein